MAKKHINLVGATSVSGGKASRKKTKAKRVAPKNVRANRRMPKPSKSGPRRRR